MYNLFQAEKFVSSEAKTTHLSIAIISEFTNQTYPAGGETRYFEIARRLVQKGHKVTWICMSQAPPTRPIDPEGITYLYLGSKVKNPPMRSLWNFLTFSVALLLHLRSNHYDIVDAQTYSPLPTALLGTLFSSSRLVATIHDVTDKDNRDFFQWPRLATILETLILKLPFRKIVTVSQATKKLLTERHGIKPETVDVIYSGTSFTMPKLVASNKKAYDFIYVGRLVPHKHVDQFIRICEETGARGAIVGHGPLEEDLRGQASTVSTVKFIGRLNSRNEVLGEIAKSRVLILPSTREGFGLVVLEAAALGVSTVAYAAGGVIEAIEQNVTGILVAPANFAALKEAAERILKGENATILGKAARQRAEMYFSWDETASAMETLYKKLNQTSPAHTKSYSAKYRP